MNEAFRKLAHASSNAMGAPLAFVIAVLFTAAWALSGPLFDFSDTWQLVINTATTVLTFLAVFLIQNTQNRDSRALHMKLDELIIYTQGADNRFATVEKLSDQQIDRLEKEIHEEVKPRRQGAPLNGGGNSRRPGVQRRGRATRGNG